MNNMEGCIQNIPGWGGSATTQEKPIIANGWEERICRYAAECKQSQDPKTFHNRCEYSPNGEGCEYNPKRERE